MTRVVGRSIRRKEDARLLTGRGQYAADFRLPGMLHAAFLRSSHAHARVGAVRAKAALALPGVVAVVTADDLGDIGRIPVRLGSRPRVLACLQPPLARDKVRYVGEPVAVVVAESRYLAEDALDLVEVDCDPLPAVPDVRRALAPGSPVLQAAIEGNLVDTIEIQKGDAARALASAPCRVRERFSVQRHTGVPIMDYLMPTAIEVPESTAIRILEETPTPLNPLGVKGAGEGGSSGCGGAIANAIGDALAPLGVTISELLSPDRLLGLILAAHRGER